MKKILIFILLPITSLFCQDIDYTTLSEKEIIKIINESLKNKDKNIDPIFQSLDPEDKNYKRFEKYVLDEVSSMVDSEDLDYPLYLVESVLYNNLENEDAQELYTIIINRQIEIKERIEEEVIKEEEKVEEIEEVAKELDALFDEEVLLESTFNRTDGLLESISKIEDKKRFNNYINHNFIYPLSLSYYNSEVNDDYLNRDSKTHNIRGISLSSATEYKNNILNFRSDLYISANYLNGSSESKPNFVGDILISLGIPVIPFPMYLSSGFYYNYYYYDDSDSSNIAITTLPSPLVGLSFYDLKFLYIMQLDLGVYGLIAPIYTNSLDSGLFARCYLTINVFRFAKYSIEVKGGLDYLLLNEGGLYETSYIPKLGLGVSIYE